MAGRLQDVVVVLKADFMWHFERAKTDANGAFRFEELMAAGWDMSAWRPGMTGNGPIRSGSRARIMRSKIGRSRWRRERRPR